MTSRRDVLRLGATGLAAVSFGSPYLKLTTAANAAEPVKGGHLTAAMVLEPASPGTGLIAGASVRAVCEAAGIRNILTKSHGSGNPVNVVKAVEQGLKNMRTRQGIEDLRGVKLDADAGSWRLQNKPTGGGDSMKGATKDAKQEASS